MTQEEKAKAYDEALEDMRAIYPNLKGDAKLAVEHAFPELAESEDEKMVVKIARTLSFAAAHNLITDYDELIAMQNWLEKQKETGIRWFKSDNVKNPDKPYIDKAGMFYTTDGRMCYASEIEKQKRETLRDFIDDFPYSDKQKDTEFTHHETNESLKDAVTHQMEDDGDVDDFIRKGIDDIALKYAELGARWQKEQKPADDMAFEEWIDDWWKHNKVNNPDSYDKGDEIQFDERGFKNFCRGIRNMYAEQKPVEPNWIHHKVNLSDCSEEYIKAYYDGWNNCNQQHAQHDAEQKPTGWSREDENMRSAILQDLANIKIAYPKVNIQDEFDWLKSLPERFNLQPKQEWNEEDEEMRGTCIDLLEHFPRPCGEVIGPWKDCISWLKSLRPSWKPSEKQMNALYNVINPCDHVDKKALESLYKQLEKLI